MWARVANEMSLCDWAQPQRAAAAPASRREGFKLITRLRSVEDEAGRALGRCALAGAGARHGVGFVQLAEEDRAAVAGGDVAAVRIAQVLRVGGVDQIWGDD